jgi:Ca-activated chloride channel family protein
MPEQFHFLHPQWFLALVPLLALLWWVRRPGTADSSWRRVCDNRLLAHLLNAPRADAGRLSAGLLACGWLLATVALADPVWQRQPQPVYRNQQARVVVLDLSRSMLSTDLKPSRLERARLKVADILRRSREGQTGLVVFAGDAFVVAPLTSDTHTIRALLDPLQPDLMPVQGSRLDLGLKQAAGLLEQAGVRSGDIVAITDGSADNAATTRTARQLGAAGYRVSVLGVGTTDPAPVPDGQGGYLRDVDGALVMPALDADALRRLAIAGGGHYSDMTADGTDLDRVLRAPTPTLNSTVAATELTTERWQSQGPWLVLALLPIAALAFRRGWLLSLPLVMFLTLSATPQPASASLWNDLWQRRDQQADAALQAGDPQRARRLATEPLRRGTAAYRAGDYSQAWQDFARSKGPQGAYNRGNALARLGRYHDAIAAYEQALQADPAMDDAAHNKAQVEKLLRQQQQQSKDSAGRGQSATEPQRHDTKQPGDKEPEPAARDTSTDPADQDQQAAPRAHQDGQSHHAAGDDAAPSTDQPGSEHRQAQSSPPPSAPSRTRQPRANATPGAGPGAAEDHSNDKRTQAPRLAGAIPAGAGDSGSPGQPLADASPAGPSDPASREQQQADERWLRRIPDDPGGLLRRKFLYQYSRRDTDQQRGGPPW